MTAFVNVTRHPTHVLVGDDRVKVGFGDEVESTNDREEELLRANPRLAEKGKEATEQVKARQESIDLKKMGDDAVEKAGESTEESGTGTTTSKTAAGGKRAPQKPKSKS